VSTIWHLHLENSFRQEERSKLLAATNGPKIADYLWFLMYLYFFLICRYEGFLKWRYPYSKSSILIGFPLESNHIGDPPFLETPI
jgi:hypothetical protein